MRLKQIGVSLLLILGAANAFAAPAAFRHDGRDAVRAYQVQGMAMDRHDPRNQPQMPQQNERRRREFAPPDSSGSGAQGDPQSFDNGRRQGRMTPEERRALRRQIDEVGHDIYAPKR
ncbi:MAG: hypothetical protein ACREX0_13870 [Noviherbaspirillum sp.]